MTSRPKPAHTTMSSRGPHRNISWNHHRARHFKRKDIRPDEVDNQGAGTGSGDAAHDEKNVGQGRGNGYSQVPMVDSHGHRVNHAGHRVTPGIQPDGESGRSWFHPWHFFKIIWTSSCTASKWTNILWPWTIAAMVLWFTHGPPLWIFITAFIGMIPAANLVGFAGQEVARKIPKVAGVLLETTFGSVVEIILFMVLLVQGREENVPVIRAAILGSILANLLMCLGKFQQRTFVLLTSADDEKDSASSSAASSTPSKPSTRPFRKSDRISCSLLDSVSSSQQSTTAP